jgi:hypothetical protein
MLHKLAGVLCLIRSFVNASVLTVTDRAALITK